MPKSPSPSAPSRVRAMLLLALLCAACARDGEHAAAESAAVVAMPAPAVAAADAAAQAPGTGAAPRSTPAVLLAYAHQLAVTLPRDQIEPRARALQDACLRQRYGDCVVLDASVEGGDAASARITVRAAPAAIEPLAKLASADGDVAQRTTRAEDLAMVIADNALQQDRLKREHARLLEFQERRDMKLGDVIALSERLASVEAQLEALTRDAAQHRRRVDTQLLTVQLAASSAQQGSSEIGRALDDFGGLFNGTVSALIRIVAVVLPLLLLGVPALWLATRAWRRVRARRPAA